MNSDTKRLLKARAHAQRALQLNDELSFGVNWWPWWPNDKTPCRACDGSGYTSTATRRPATRRPATSTPATSTPATSTPATSTPATSTPATSTPATSTPAPVGPKDYKIEFEDMTMREVEETGIMNAQLEGCIIRTPESECSLKPELRKIADEECILRDRTKCKSKKKKCDDYLQLPCECYVHKTCFVDHNEMNESLEAHHVEHRILNDEFPSAKLTCTSCRTDNTYRLLLKGNVLKLPLVEHDYKHTSLSTNQLAMFKHYTEQDKQRKESNTAPRTTAQQTTAPRTTAPQKPRAPAQKTSTEKSEQLTYTHRRAPSPEPLSAQRIRDKSRR